MIIHIIIVIIIIIISSSSSISISISMIMFIFKRGSLLAPPTPAGYGLGASALEDARY